MTKVDAKSAKITKKEPSKPLAKKEPQKLEKNEEKRVVPSVQVESQPAVPAVPIDNTPKSTYIVMDEKGQQKLVDFGEEKVSCCGIL